MSTTRAREHVVLIEDEQARLTVARVTWWQELGAKVGGFWLDRELAAGTAPEASALLALRAETLVAEACRDDLASCLVNIGLQVGESTSRRSPRITPRASTVRNNIRGIFDLASRLRDTAPVSARGMARVAILVTDGSGPMFYSTLASDLADAISGARDALELPVTNWWVSG